ncbi:MAG: DNA polymerase III subunit alpha [Spirochaetia bacterium]|jgi:DNA polymerase-3 subunit alpha|nr:DNA polymerase III subunit alpha [Spirochaetia bacterium]
MPEFVHLHNHSEYSLLDGAAAVEKMPALAKKLGMGHLALTDHGNMFGILEFYDACVKNGVHPILGCEFYVAPGSRHVKSGGTEERNYYHLILLAKDQQGYGNMMRLCSLGYTEGFYYKPRIDEELLGRYHEGLICSSACIAGEVPLLILDGREKEAAEKAWFYSELFGRGNYYLEIQDHGIPEEKRAARGLVKIAKDLGLPLIVTNDMHYLQKEHADAHDTFLRINTKKKKTDFLRMGFDRPEFYMKSPDEMGALFAELPDALGNTLEVAEKCDVRLNRESKPLLPDYGIPPEFSSPDEYLRHLAEKGFRARYPDSTSEQRGRLEYELGVIMKTGYAGYFLIVWDFIRYAREQGIPVGPGRGSGAGSIVAYSLRITDIDPLKYKLVFERFLNPERVTMPDFDIDICYERRQEVIAYVTEKYGKDRVGQIITFGTLKPKAVLKDVARVLGVPFDESTAITKMVPDGPKVTLDDALKAEPKLAELRKREGVYPLLVETSLILEGLARNASTHPAGVVIGKSELGEYVPLYRDATTGAISTQYTKGQLESCSLVKMDLLGLKTLTLIKNAQDIIRRKIPDFDIDRVPEDDAKTFALLCEGKSACVFQFESPGMQGILKRAKPASIEDLIALNALYRPGPMDNIDQFVDSKNGKQKIHYPLPELEPVLKETYGVIVYQEQVMQIAQIVAGFTLGHADELRRAMSKKNMEKMVKEKAAFIEGAVAKGFAAKKADKIFELLVPFAGYGFNKSHAAAYSVLAYRTAYMKANFPEEFMAANLTNESGDKLAVYIAETQEMGIKILPPDINLSEKYFTVVGGDIVYGLLGIKNIGGAAVEKILEARKEKGNFTSFFDFLDRLDAQAAQAVNKRVLEASVQCGLFDSLHPNRAALFTSIDKAVGYATAKKESRMYGQASLFDACGEEDFREPPLEDIADWPVLDKLKQEKELLGYYFSGHPLDPFRAAWQKCAAINLRYPEKATKNKRYNFIGMLRDPHTTITKNGEKMAFAVLDDYNGSIALTVFPRLYERAQGFLSDGAIVGLNGRVEFDAKKDSYQILVEEFKSPNDLEAQAASELHIQIGGEPHSEEDFFELRGILTENPGNCVIYLHIGCGGGRPGVQETIVKVSSQMKAAPRENVLDRIRGIPWVRKVWKQ